MTVTCLGVRRALLTDPEDLSVEALAHVDTCPACARVAAHAARETQLIRQAVRTRVPADLHANILMARSFSAHPRRRLVLGGIAAGLVLVITLGALISVPLYREHQLTSDVLALMEAADYALENREPLQPDAVRQALAPVGFSLEPALETVSFAGRCVVQGTLAGHLVVRDQQRPVTVFLIPHHVLRRPLEFKDNTWSGVLLPEHGGGTIAVLAPRGTDMREVTSRVKAAVRWPA